jgi:transcriptional regulator with XRE-family HTH domain
MLNLPLLHSALRERGLTAAELADHCDVSLEVVSSWLLGNALPRPAKLRSLSTALGLSPQALYSSSVSPVSFVFGMDAQPHLDARENAESLAGLLHSLAYFLPPRPLWASASLAEPRLDATYIRKVAADLRAYLGIAVCRPLTADELLQLHQEAGTVIIPVLDASTDTFASMYELERHQLWIRLNLASTEKELAFQLARALAHGLSAASLSDMDCAPFAQCLAAELLHLESFEFDTAEAVPPSTPAAYVIGCESVLRTPVFKALEAFQQQEGGTNPAFVSEILSLPLGDAVALSRYLLPSD